MTYCVGIACVRNEADIVEVWARYNLQLLDELQVVNNLSDDRTRWVLEQLQAEGLRLHLHDCNDPSYPQADLMNGLAKELACRPEVDFVVPLDADELLAVSSRAGFQQALATIPLGHAGAMSWRTYLPEPASGSSTQVDPLAAKPFFRTMQRHRSHELKSTNKLILRADLCADYSWTRGSHKAFHDRTGEPAPRVDLPFRLAHFPVRDAAQLARKVMMGSQARRLRPKRGPRESWHLVALEHQLRAADETGQAMDLEAVAMAYSLYDPKLYARKLEQQVHRLPVPDFPAVQQRYPVPVMSTAQVMALLRAGEATQQLALLWRDLSAEPLQALLWLKLAQCYAASGLLWQAGYTARQALRLDAALLPTLQALAIGSWQDAGAGDDMLGRPSLPDAYERAVQIHAWLQKCPGDWLSWLYLARLLELLPKTSPGAAALPASGEAIAQAQRFEPLAGEALHWLGVWRLKAGDPEAAILAFRGLLNLVPMRHGSMMQLADALERVGNLPAAQTAFARAAKSSNPDFLLTLSARMYQYNHWEEAIRILERALELRPGHVNTLLALAKIHWAVYDLSRALACCEQVLALEPGNEEVNHMLAARPGRMGDAQGHFDAMQARHAAGGGPNFRPASSLAMASLYHDALSPQAVADLHRRLCAPVEAAMNQPPVFSNERSPGRRLRVGLVTGDLHRQHPVNLFMLPVLARLDRARVQTFVYYTGTTFDGYTRQAQRHADGWLEAASLDDKALRAAVIADGIDILIDLAGHTTTNRLAMFAMRAAPVQATFLGYPHSTGLTTIDWLIGDAIVSPAEHAHLFSEGLAQLPGSVFCWAPVDNYPLTTARPANADLVFGSFNNAMKLSAKTIALWARVLHAVPDAKLLLKAAPLRDESVKARFERLFGGHGISPQRLIMRGPSGLDDMMQEYADMDIALDPTPYNGGTTTLQALWMGVPVLSLAGENFVSRMGASFLATLGRPDWAANDEDAYVANAVRLAADRAAVRSGRAGLRERMQSSGLCDIQSYVKNFQTLLESMWNRYSSGNLDRLISAVPSDVAKAVAEKSS
jgi:predicted O-linked N-acetylglucosamine transferase (SPINDLY family)